MTNSTIHTPRQPVEMHDAATSKRYLAALREVQAENARLWAHIQEAAESHQGAMNDASEFCDEGRFRLHSTFRDYHLAALGETK